MATMPNGLEEEAPRAVGVDGAPLDRLPAWKIEHAKTRLSELVCWARSDGPQRVTCRGRDAVVVMSAEGFAGLQPDTRTGADLAAFLQRTSLGELKLTREEDRGRDLPF
jgi:prevent-host-death family protein